MPNGSQTRALTSVYALAVVALATVAMRFAGLLLHEPLGAIAYGVGILACAFLMGVAAELLQLDVSRSLAVIVVALLAVLPEYAVDVYFAWSAGRDETYAAYALANMTGANRLLIGVGWPFIAFLLWWKTRRRAVDLEPANGGEVLFLSLATLWSLSIPLRGELSLVDAGALFLLFGLYLRFALAQPVEEVHLAGPAEVLARATPSRRRVVTACLLLVAGGGIFAASEPFAEGMLAAGGALGVNEYYLVQWLAPLASEAPEFLVAAVLVLHGQATAGFGALLSSKVNQWTLLVGAVPVAFAISSAVHGDPRTHLVLDGRQCGEILLTAAQSYVGVCILLNRRFELVEAALLFFPFLAQLVTSIALESFGASEATLHAEKLAFSALHFGIGTVYLLRYRRELPFLMGVAFKRARRSGQGP